ncbi:TPA_asm: L [Betula betacytorhabdovirus 2]|nr:TPA_asm: L [Betula betacytorhabdovirus 2]
MGDFDFLTSFMEDMKCKQENMPGLGDYHLRSALKKADPVKLASKIGRPREIANFETLSSIFPRKKTRAGDPPRLLSKVFQCEAKDEIRFLENGWIKDKMKAILDSQQILLERLSLEISGYNNSNSTTALGVSQKERLKEILKRTSLITQWTWKRAISEIFVIVSNALSSKRELPEFLEGRNPSVVISTDESSKYVMFPAFGHIWILVGELVGVFENKELETDEGTIDVYDVNIVRMINDKITERDIIIRTSRVGHIYNEIVYPDEKNLETLFLILDKALEDRGNHAYRLIKIYESLCIGYILKRGSAYITDNEEFLNVTVRDFTDENQDLISHLELLLKFLESVESLHHLTQYYGLFRCWGHPVIDSLSGLKKAMKIGLPEKPEISRVLAKSGGNLFMEVIYLGYFKKWGRYPEHSIATNIPHSSYIARCIEDRETIDVDNAMYDISDWDYFVSNETFSLPSTFNLAMIIDDKAISPPQDFLIKVAKKRANMMDPTERRGVLKWMNEVSEDCDVFLKNIAVNGLDQNDCVIGLFPKERELNSVPRMFALMSSKMRDYVVVTEHMIAHDVLPYFPQITMTNDLLSLTKKTYSATRTQEKSGIWEQGNLIQGNVLSRSKTRTIRGSKSRTVCLNIDFEKWNLNMRYEATEHVFRRMGELYGLPELFNQTYDIFKKSYIYVADESAKIETEFNLQTGKDELKTDGIHSYTGQLGGYEGLRQKGWTVFTVVFIKMVCDKYPISYKLMGQGDNQVLMITLFTSLCSQDGEILPEGIDQMKSILNKLIQDLERTFLQLGLPLKTLESWKSEDFFLYGKSPIFRCLPLSMSLKKICRAFPFSNDDTMTIDNVLGSIFTNAQSSAMSDIDHHISYSMSLVEAYQGMEFLLNYHPLTGTSICQELLKERSWNYNNPETRTRMTYQNDNILDIIQFISGILILPKSLGGSNGITEFEFVMRGFPDNQTRDLTYLKLILDSKDYDLTEYEEALKTKEIIRRFVRFNFSEGKNFELIVEDPCSINLINPISPLSLLRKKVKEILGTNMTMRNKEFMQLFQLTKEKNKNLLMKELASEDILFPRVLHDLYAATIYGYVDGIVSKVDKTSTIQRTCLNDSEIDIMEIICETEWNFIKYLIWRQTYTRILDLPGEPSGNCPTNYIRWARNYGWGRQILGVTVPFPAHTLKISTCRQGDCPDPDYITAYISQTCPTNFTELMSKVGRAPPYFGSYTKEKVQSYEKAALYGSEPLLSKVIKMLRLIGWSISENSNTATFLNNTLSSMSDLDPDLFVSDPSQVTGSLEHRYRDSALKHGALTVSMYGLFTWLHMSTDTLLTYSKGSKNVTLHFQALLCWVQFFMCDIIQGRCNGRRLSYLKSNSEFHFHVKCHDCIVPAEENVPDINEKCLKYIPELKMNKYCYVNDSTIVLRDHSYSACKSVLKVYRDFLIGNCSVQRGREIVHEYWASKICQDIISGNLNDDSAMSSGLMDVGEYPRISFISLDLYLILTKILKRLEAYVMIRTVKTSNLYDFTCNPKFLRIEILKLIQSKPDGKFLGLSMFYSWPEQIKKMKDLSYFYIVNEYPMSISACCTSAKLTLINFVIEADPDLNPRESRYVNLNLGRSMDLEVITKVLNPRVGAKKLENCSFCIRSFLLHLIVSKNWMRSDLDRCKLKHIWFQPKKLFGDLALISDSVDNLEKSRKKDHNSHNIISACNVSRNFRVNKDRLREIRGYNAKVHLLLSSNKKENSELFTDILSKQIVSDKSDNISRTYRIIPYDSSSMYRVIELLIHIKEKIGSAEKILVLGDGFGNSSVCLQSFFEGKIESFSLVDCTTASPQTFPHSMPPALLSNEVSGRIDINCGKRTILNVLEEDCWKTISELTDDKYTCILSEVEPEHDNKYSAYLTMLQTYFKIKTRMTIVVKLRAETEKDAINLIRYCGYHWERMELLITPYNSSKKIEFWLILSYKRLRPIMNTIFKNETDLIELYSIFQSHVRGLLFSKVNSDYYEKLNTIIMTSDRVNKSLIILKMWLSKSKVNWSGKSASSLYHSVFTRIIYKNTIKKVMDWEGNSEKYLYDEKFRELEEIVACLMMSQIELEGEMKYLWDNIKKYRLYYIVVNNKSYPIFTCWPTASLDGLFKEGTKILRPNIPNNFLNTMRFAPLLRVWIQERFVALRAYKEVKYSVPNLTEKKRKINRSRNSVYNSIFVFSYIKDWERFSSDSKWMGKLPGIIPISKIMSRKSFEIRDLSQSIQEDLTFEGVF